MVNSGKAREKREKGLYSHKDQLETCTIFQFLKRVSLWCAFRKREIQVPECAILSDTSDMSTKGFLILSTLQLIYFSPQYQTT